MTESRPPAEAGAAPEAGTTAEPEENPELVHGIVVAHSDLAAALVRAVEGIAGERGALVPLSNERKGAEVMRRDVESACGQGPAIVFTDLASGSCALAGRFAAAGGARVAVITGANLPMLLDFVFHREMSLPQLVERLIGKGRDGIAGDAGVPEAAGGVDRPDTD